MKKNIALIFFSVFFTLSLIYLLVFAWVGIFQKYKDKNNFKSLENLNFHEQYSNKIHHLRGNNWPHHKKNMLWNKEDYLFSVISKFSNDKENYLIQGDSWAEYMVFKDKINKVMTNIAKEKKIGLINSGVSSYSPSPMKIQYKILEEEYGFKPDFLISIIDQTDIGDELCRYRHNIVEYEDGTVKYIKRELNTGAVMDASKFYAFSRILLEKESFINFHITNYYFVKTLNQFKTRINNIKKHGIKNSGNYKCEFQQIQKYLFNLENNEEEYFKKRTQEYFNYLISREYLKKIFVITFPHKSHLEGSYKINISNIINDLELPKKIIHIDFNKIIENGSFEKQDIFEKGDPASHLTEETHAMYLKKIFEIIKLNK